MRAALVLSLLALAACAAREPAGQIRDLRPTTIELGDEVIVETDGPVLIVGAPTTLVLPQLTGLKHQVVSAPAVAIAPDRALVHAGDLGLSFLPIRGQTAVVLEQRVDGRTLQYATAPEERYLVDLFPPSSRAVANLLAPPSGEGAAKLPGPLSGWGWLADALVLLAIAALVAMPVPVIAGLIVIWERKISGYMQSRWGPNRVGPNGWLQWLADGMKLLLKEDIVPREADALLFRVSPYLAFVGLFLTLLVLPLSSRLVAVDLSIGVLYLLSVTSIIVVSILMGGWASNSKWALLGGMRSAAQIISYEIPASIALLTVVVPTGALSMQALVARQGGAPWEWNLFHDPFCFIAGLVYFVAALAEGNRTPFDLPEAESELVAGYATEYSGFRFSIYPMVEWVNLFVMGAIVSALFLGGWRLPFVSVEAMRASLLLDALGAAVFLLKDVAIIFVVIWIRWTLPRLRVDQMMSLCWKYLVPLALVCFCGSLAYSLFVPPLGQRAVGLVLFLLLGVGGGARFWRRVRAHRLAYRDLVLNEKLGAMR